MPNISDFDKGCLVGIAGTFLLVCLVTLATKDPLQTGMERVASGKWICEQDIAKEWVCIEVPQ
jgi:hypothetical protein